MAARASAKGPLTVLATSDSGFEKRFAALCDRRFESDGTVEKTVQKIIAQVREGGDDALLALVKKHDGAKLDALEVTRGEWEAGIEAVDPADRAALGKAAMRVREFHRRRIPSSWEMREEGGALMGVKVRPLTRVAVYAPGGKAAYPSSVIMTAVPASVVDVPEIVLATPPEKDGSLRPEILMAAKLAGVHRIFKMGGAHAVAALAYGTESVPAVDKIVGPGSVWVAAAKAQVFGQVAIDSEAGPSEILIVADRSATAAWVAADLLSQAEHDEVACPILVTSNKGLVTKVQDQLTRQLKKLERAKIAKQSLASRGAVIVTKNLDESLEIADRYAPEHLVLALEKPDVALKSVKNAGAVFLGHYTPEAVGDYLAGPSHVLPTGGTARFFSPLGVEDFVKRMSFMRFEPPKMRELGAEVVRLAELEGLGGHGQAVELRLQKIRRARREREAAREAEVEL